jgi:hypothetical protein
VMTDRGYPMDNFDQRSADISVDHPDVVENYRAAHGISLASDHGQATTEDLRQAMVHYRSLFETLLGTTTEGDSAQAAGSSSAVGGPAGEGSPEGGTQTESSPGAVSQTRSSAYPETSEE